MESTRLHHHQQFQDHHHQLPPIFPSSPLPNDNSNIICNKLASLSSSSCYGVSTPNWTQTNNILNHQPQLISICNPNDDDMTPHGFIFHQWAADNNNKHDELSTVEAEEAAATAATQQFYCSTTGDGGEGGGGSRLITSHIYPTINVPSGNHSNSNLEALDLFNSDEHHLHHSQEFEFQSFGIDHHNPHQLQQSNQQRPLFCTSFSDIGAACNYNKKGSPTGTRSGTGEQKKQSKCVEPMPPHAPLMKKSRLDSRASSSPPFKVRKEKLGDRVAALQQLVAPFGKTDTASVLMEAIGYINFLQNQVQTLSFPYMKSSRNQACNRAIMGQGQQHQDNTDQCDETRMMTMMMPRDLRSRGLCLVPLSCISFLIADGGGGGGGGFWPPPTFPGP